MANNARDVALGSGSVTAATVATVAICILVGYPVAYYIAVYGGRWKNLLIALAVTTVAGLFTSFGSLIDFVERLRSR